MTDPLATARLRIRNSGLAGDFGSAVDVVSRHLAMQSQDYGPAKWSIAQRTSGVDDAEIQKAVSDGSVIRTHVLRPTWHFVSRNDLRWLLALTGPRVQRSMAGRYRELGLDDATRAKARDTLAAALAGGNQLTRDQLAEVLERNGINTAGQRLPHLLSDAELETVICSGGRSGKHHTYALADERLPQPTAFELDRALTDLVRRYLNSHGPATVHDMSWWSGLTITDIRRGLNELGDDVVSREVDDLELWSVAPSEEPMRVAPVAHLLQTYDELIVGYTTSRFFGDPRAQAARAAWRDRSLPNGLVLIGAGIAGHWRRRIAGSKVHVEVLVYDEPSRRETTAIEQAANDLAVFLDLTLELTMGTI